MKKQKRNSKAAPPSSSTARKAKASTEWLGPLSVALAFAAVWAIDPWLHRWVVNHDLRYARERVESLDRRYPNCRPLLIQRGMIIREYMKLYVQGKMRDAGEYVSGRGRYYLLLRVELDFLEKSCPRVRIIRRLDR